MAKKELTSEDKLRAAVSLYIMEVEENMREDVPEAQYREYLGEAYKFYRSPIFHDILRRVSEPITEFIVAKASTFEEVVAHRAVLLAVQDIKLLVETMARQYEQLMVEDKMKPTDIIPNA